LNVLVVLLMVVTVRGVLQATPQTSEPERQAQVHFNVAQAALNDNNFDMALQEHEQAANLGSPRWSIDPPRLKRTKRRMQLR
jgi:hypothetical protein